MRTGQSTARHGANQSQIGPNPKRNRHALRTIADLAHTELLDLADAIFTDLEEHLFDAANNAEDHIHQGFLLDAARKIRLNRQSILEALSQQISGSHRQLVSDSKKPGDRSTGRLATAKIDELALQSDGEAAVSAAKRGRKTVLVQRAN